MHFPEGRNILVRVVFDGKHTELISRAIYYRLMMNALRKYGGGRTEVAL